MSKKMDWRNARLTAKRPLSLKDENEYRGRDAAARWLERTVNHASKAKSIRANDSWRGKI